MVRSLTSTLTLLTTLTLGACGAGVPEVVFSFEEPPSDLLIGEIDAAKVSIDAAVYTFTDNAIAEALLRAHDRGVKVRLITDDGQAYTLDSQEALLARLTAGGVGICARPGIGGGIMHHKFAVFDTRYVLTGSFNWTEAASLRNAEDLLRLDDPLLAERYATLHTKLWTCEETSP